MVDGINKVNKFVKMRNDQQDYTLKLIAFVNSGQYGEVYLAIDCDKPEQTYAVKIMSKIALEFPRRIQRVRRETAILKAIKSRHVVRFEMSSETQDFFYIGMEYCNLGNLEELLQIRKRFDEQEARFLIKQIITGVYDCHKKRAVHRDLKPANIMLSCKEKFDSEESTMKFLASSRILDGEIQLKITDLGFSKILTEEDGFKTGTTCGTPGYIAPEIWQSQDGYNEKVDVFSIGAIFFELLTGRKPQPNEVFMDNGKQLSFK